MNIGQTVTCECQYNKMIGYLGANRPSQGEQFQISGIKIVHNIKFLRFDQYDRDNMKIYFSSTNFS